MIKFLSWKFEEKNNLTNMFKSHASIQTMDKTYAKFQKDRTKAVGVALIKYSEVTFVASMYGSTNPFLVSIELQWELLGLSRVYSDRQLNSDRHLVCFIAVLLE